MLGVLVLVGDGGLRRGLCGGVCIAALMGAVLEAIHWLSGCDCIAATGHGADGRGGAVGRDEEAAGDHWLCLGQERLGLGRREEDALDGSLWHAVRREGLKARVAHHAVLVHAVDGQEGGVKHLYTPSREVVTGTTGEDNGSAHAGSGRGTALSGTSLPPGPTGGALSIALV